MPWTAEDIKRYHWKSSTPAQASKAAAIANAMLREGADEAAAIATAIRRAKMMRGAK